MLQTFTISPAARARNERPKDRSFKDQLAIHSICRFRLVAMTRLLPKTINVFSSSLSKYKNGDSEGESKPISQTGNVMLGANRLVLSKKRRSSDEKTDAYQIVDSLFRFLTLSVMMMGVPNSFGARKGYQSIPSVIASARSHFRSIHINRHIDRSLSACVYRESESKERLDYLDSTPRGNHMSSISESVRP